MAYEGKYAVYSGLDDSSKLPAENHMHLDTEDDEKNVRINSRDYAITSGEHCAMQSKPNVSVGGTTGITAFEASPRFASGCKGSKLVGIMSNPILKGGVQGVTGDLSSAMRCYEGKLESDTGSSRTVAEAYVLHAMQALHGTVTDGPWVIGVDAGGGNVAWAGFGKFPNDGQVANNNDSQAGGQVGWLKVKIGTLTGYIQVESLA